MRDSNGRWVKGAASPNPGGRPSVVGEIQQLAREHTTEAVETLCEIMRNKEAPAQARVAAASAVLDRGFGKPAQAIAMSHTNQDIADMMEEINCRTRGLPNGQSIQ